MTAIQRVLAASSCSETVGRLEEMLLTARRVEFDAVSNGFEALARATSRALDMLLIEFPLAELDMEHFLTHLRAPGSPSSRSPVVVLAGTVDRRTLEGIRPELLAGVEVCTSCLEALRSMSRELRLNERLRTELRVAIVGTTADARGTQLARTHDISTSGMLLGAEHLLPVGTIAPIAVELGSGQPLLRGRAEVVRHADPAREPISGMALRFVDLVDESERRLSEFIAGALELQRPGQPRPAAG